jgi:hypothetical protein
MAIRLFLTMFTLTACGPADSPPPEDQPIEIIGSYRSSFGEESVAAASWDHGFATNKIVAWDNDANWVITQTAADAQDNANFFHLIFWTEPVDGSFYYCTNLFNQSRRADIDAGIASPPDSSDPANTGCGGFSWTSLAPRS